MSIGLIAIGALPFCPNNDSIQNYTLLHTKQSLLSLQLITEINVQLALFRDLLIHIGQPHDSPELRERVRRLRRACVEATKTTSNLVLPNCKKLV